MGESVNFDPAAATYEATRGFPAGVGQQVGRALADWIGPLTSEARLLEIGVGTGRIARPLSAAGLPMVGVDLSANMLGELRRLHSPAALYPMVVRADATRLPFGSSRFTAAVGVHIFHLIPQWRQALTEIQRVVAPGGSLFLGWDHRSDDAPSARLMRAWRALLAAREFSKEHPGVAEFERVDDELAGRGVAASERVAATWINRRTVADLLEGFRRRTWSSTWNIPADVFASAFDELRVWAQRELGADETLVETPVEFRWKRFILPG